jgi:hypothetical protein
MSSAVSAWESRNSKASSVPVDDDLRISVVLCASTIAREDGPVVVNGGLWAKSAEDTDNAHVIEKRCKGKAEDSATAYRLAVYRPSPD